MTENKDAAVRPPVAEIREVFVECETAMAKFGETKKQADHRAWKRKGSVLEVVCVGHMRNCLDYIEYLETIAPPPAQDAMREALEAAADAWDAFGVARSAMNAAIPRIDATPAERALYDERYKADHEAQREHWRAAVELAQSARSILAALSAPNVAGERDYTRERIAELVAEGDGFWVPCSGCQESVDGCVSTADYPFSEQFQCHPGSGCRECGGIGVIWDTTDYEDMARFCLSTPQPESVEPAVQLVALADCPPGPFEFNGGLGFKTEYGAMRPVANHALPCFSVSRFPDAYCMESGEFFWGGTTTHEERAKLLVRPIDVAEAPQVVAKHGEGR